MRNLIYLTILTTALLIAGCDPIDDENTSGKDVKFLVLQGNSTGKAASGASLSILTIKKGEPEYEKVNDLYPAESMHKSADISKSRVAIGLHTDFNVTGKVRQTKGAWFDLESGDWEELPLLPAGNGRYNYFDVASAKVSESGHIFYLSSSNDQDYFDDYRASLVRYDPKTDKLLQASNPSSFALSQPEKGWDTEAAQYKSQFYPSKDGRYVYGVVDAFGVNGGMLHWDYKILFKYDFETDTYTRLGEKEDKDIVILGITSDKTYVAYTSSISNVYKRKYVNTSTNAVNDFSISGGQGIANPSKWNSSGYCADATDNTIGIYNILEDVNVYIKTPSRPYYSQFAADGKSVYFLMESGAKKFLCKTSDLTAKTTIDTLCTLSSNTIDFFIIK
ncbi:MAG: hypothetical protein GXX78_11865 [Bacteroidales bacterium]|nr:hypothetical protein [Bacteroidales bacterium]